MKSSFTGCHLSHFRVPFSHPGKSDIFSLIIRIPPLYSGADSEVVWGLGIEAGWGRGGGGSGSRGEGIEPDLNSKFYFHGKFGINLGCRIYPKYSQLLLFTLYFSSTSTFVTCERVYNCWMSCKQCRPRSDAAFCGI